MTKFTDIKLRILFTFTSLSIYVGVNLLDRVPIVRFNHIGHDLKSIDLKYSGPYRFLQLIFVSYLNNYSFRDLGIARDHSYFQLTLILSIFQRIVYFSSINFSHFIGIS